jgi:hypothetical protein
MVQNITQQLQQRAERRIDVGFIESPYVPPLRVFPFAPGINVRCLDNFNPIIADDTGLGGEA